MGRSQQVAVVEPDTQSAPPSTAGNVIAGVRALVPALIPSEARVAKFVLDRPGEVIHLSVTELAGASETSASTVIRFCQKLGFEGYQGFKIALAQDSAPPLQRLQADVNDTDPLDVVLAKVTSAAADAVANAGTTIDPLAFGRVVDLLASAERVLVTGVGTSQSIAQDIAYRLLTIGVRVDAPVDIHVQHVTASLLSSRDACLAISHTGSTRETIAVVDAASRAGASTAAITSFFRSPLTEIADVALVTGGRETAFRVEAMASRLAHLAVLDALHVALAIRHRDRSDAALAMYDRTLSQHRF